jgi:oligopeptide transport system substrate-binding protein
MQRSSRSLAIVLSISFAMLAGFTGCTKKVDDTDTTLNIVVKSNVKALDPAYANDRYSNTVVAQIYEPLFTYHYLKRPAELIPNLAESMPTASKDGLTHTIKIKKGLRFQDDAAFADGKGREVTAKDFTYAWRRMVDPKNTTEGAWIFENRIVGLDEWKAKVGKGEADYETAIEGLQTPDDHTIVIKLKKPYYQLYYVLAMPYSAPIPKEAVDKYGKEFVNHPVGTGPYKLKEWKRGTRVELVKNDNWRGGTYPTEGEATDEANGLLADAGKSVPFSDRIVISEQNEDQPRWLNFMKGNTDYVEIPKDNFDNTIKDKKVIPELAAKGLKLEIAADPEVTYTGFNMLDPLVGKNKNLRLAIAHAIDTKTLITKFYNDRAIVAQSPIPPGVDGYDPEFKNPYKEFNVAKAKEFLAKAGYPEGKGLPELEYADTASATSRQMTEFYKQSLEAIGIKMRITTSSWPQFTQKLNEKKAQIFGIAWGADYPDAENFLQLLYGPNESPGPNNANFNNAEYNELYKKAALLPPGPARTKLYQQMRDIFVREMPWVPSAHREMYTLQHGWLNNFKYNAVTYDYFKYLRVDPKKRAELKAKL